MCTISKLNKGSQNQSYLKEPAQEEAFLEKGDAKGLITHHSSATDFFFFFFPKQGLLM